jgi:hypothetical protein
MHKRVSLMLINYKWGYFFLLKKGQSHELDSYKYTFIFASTFHTFDIFIV